MTIKKKILGLLSIVLLGTACFFIFANWMVNSPAVSLASLRQMKPGMTESEVIALLGKPKWQKEESDGKKILTYGHPLKWYRLDIKCRSTGTVETWVHDD